MSETPSRSDEKKRRSGEKKQRSAGGVLLRIIWTFIKILIIPVLCIAALVVGLGIGYAVLGKQGWSDVFDWSTWRHMYDLVFEGNT